MCPVRYSTSMAVLLLIRQRVTLSIKGIVHMKTPGHFLCTRGFKKKREQGVSRVLSRHCCLG